MFRLALLLSAIASLQFARAQSAPTSRPTTPTETRADLRPFQPGVTIDWREPAVRVRSHVVLREGPLEFFACFAGKEHESILRMDARAEHIALALGLIGVESAPLPDADASEPRVFPPAAALIDVLVVRSTPDVKAGPQAEVEAWTWLRELRTARPPPARPWVFIGSRADGQGGLAADRSGAGLALVDISESLIGLTRSHTSSDAGLWVAAETAKIPPDDSEVELILRPARPRARRYELDWRGAARIDQQLVAVADMADLMRIDRRLQPVQRLVVWHDAKTLSADRMAHRADLLSLGVSETDFEYAVAK